MKKQSAALFWVSEINLVLWMAAAGNMIFADGNNHDQFQAAKVITISGCVLAALLQHWAYHKIYKPIRRQEKAQNKTLDRTSG